MAEKLMTPGEPTNVAPEAPPARPAPRAGQTQARAQAARPPAPEAAEDAQGDDAARAAPASSGWWMVQEDVEVPKSGGKFMLRKGKVISEKSYDVQALEDAGVKLKPAPEPAWARRLREDGVHLAR
jgi:hypothetical protein